MFGIDWFGIAAVVAAGLVGLSLLLGMLRQPVAIPLCILGLAIVIFPGAFPVFMMGLVALGALYVAFTAIRYGGSDTSITNYGNDCSFSVVNGQRQDK